jgi:hypothetical protein
MNLPLFRKGEIHVQFFDKPVTTAWVAESLVRAWTDKVAPGEATDLKWEQGKWICCKPFRSAYECRSCPTFVEKIELVFVTNRQRWAFR